MGEQGVEHRGEHEDVGISFTTDRSIYNRMEQDVRRESGNI